uniref:long-chain-fatty-acid--CoA ligase n=1 Tax=Dicentrarchus labrax TaxID=13489 RepID=A0A8P4KDY3_DICLA
NKVWSDCSVHLLLLIKNLFGLFFFFFSLFFLQDLWILNEKNMMEMYLLSIILASILIIPFALKTFCPYLWVDILYCKDLLRILVKFVSRRRRRPLFFVLDRFLEQTAAHPDKLFIVFENEGYSYKYTDTRSNKTANALQSHPGYKVGDTVALFMGNEPAFMFTWLALAKLGSPVALLNHNIRNKSLLHCFNCCRAKVLIAAPELKEAVEDVLPTLTEQGVAVLLMTKHCDTPGIESFSDKVDEASDSPLPQSLRSHITFKSPAVYIYTSGTTGLPKAAVVSQNRLLTALAVLSSNGVTASDVIYLNLPLYHTAGFIIGFIGSIETGSTIILKRKFSASQFWDDCRKNSVTVVQYIGEVMRYLCSTPRRENDKDHKVRLAIGNGVRAEIWREFLNRFGNIQVKEFYASTEGNVGFVNYAGKVGAIGRVNILHQALFPYTLIKYNTERDEPVRGANGLCVESSKGLLVSKITDIAPFVGYAQNEEQTERKRIRNVLKMGDLYFNSGDLMRIDHDNFIYFQDRVGDTFRWKGENVATTEVSDILTINDCLKEANVYGVQVPGHEGRIGMAAITVNEGAQFDGSKIYNHVVNYLPSYARPRFIRIQNAVEVTGTFKQMKGKLVEDSFDPGRIQDPLYILDDHEKSYIQLTAEVYRSIISGNIKL